VVIFLIALNFISRHVINKSVGYALKSQLQEVGNSEEHLPASARRQERPRLACEFCCLARGADGLARGAGSCWFGDFFGKYMF
jgi:hypothetical protein